MEGREDLLLLELKELNSYARHHFQLYLSWYTFFLTVNFAAMGWFTTVLLTDSLKESLPVIFQTLFFAVQIALSYVACLEVGSYFSDTHRRCLTILEAVSREVPAGEVPALPSLPVLVYLKIITLMRYTLISFGCAWVVLLGVSLYLVPLR